MANYVSIYKGDEIDTALSLVPNKVDKEAGKGLSEANFTNTEKTKLASAAPLASPAFTGVPTAPTAAVDTNNTQLANTAFVQQEIQQVIDNLALDSSSVLVGGNQAKDLISLKESDYLVTVGVSGDFATINLALAHITRFQPKYKSGGVTFEIRLLNGFVMAEQVFAEGVDLSYITITSESYPTPVTIQRSALTTDISGRFPAFGARDGAKLPVIGALFTMDSSGTASLRDGIFITNKCEVQVLEGMGVLYAGERGLHVANGSKAQARNARFMYATTFGARVSNGSIANLRLTNFSNAGQNGMALNNAYVNFLDGIADDCGDSGIFAQASYVYAQGGSCDNCQNNNTAGYSGAIEAQLGSVVIVAGRSFTGSGRNAITCLESKVVAYGALPEERTCDGSGATLKGIYAEGGEVIATKIDLTGCGGVAIDAQKSARVEARQSVLSSAGGGAISARYLSTVDAPSCTATGVTGRVADAREGSTISISNAVATGATGQAILATNAARVDASFANVSGSGAGISAEDGSTISFRGGNAQRGGTPSSGDISVATGGIISANASTGGTNITVNTLTASGIIFN